MPIECNVDIKPIDQEQFHVLDKQVMGYAFDIHNTLGRFLDESIYQEALAEHCRGAGMTALREVHIRVSHEKFTKPYYLDLFVQHGVIYELKAVKSLTRDHERQLINYLLLMNLKHGKLVNFRPHSVEYRFVSTSLTWKDRMAYELIDKDWEGNDAASCELKDRFIALLADWGTFLEASLYREALLHLISCPGSGAAAVEIRLGGRVLGAQKMCLLNSDTAWHISAIRCHFTTYEAHIKRLLTHSSMHQIHWINLDHATVTLKTLKK